METINLSENNEASNTIEETRNLSGNNNLLLSNLVTFLISAIVFGFGGYYLSQNASISSNNNLQQTNPQPDSNSQLNKITNSSLPSSDMKITGWNDYLISEIGLSFQYPTDWKVAVSPGEALTVTVVPNNSTETGFVPMQISIDTASDVNGYIHFDYIEQAKIHYMKGMSSDTIINSNLLVGGKPALSIEGTVSGEGPGSGGYISFTFIQLDNQVLVVQLGDQSLKDDFNKILSSFQFAN